MANQFWSDRCKCISSTILVSLLTVTITGSSLIYVLGYLAIKDVSYSGGKYLQEFNLDYKSFDFAIMISAFVGAVVFLIGLLAALCKKPYITCSYVMTAVPAAFYILYSA